MRVCGARECVRRVCVCVCESECGVCECSV